MNIFRIIGHKYLGWYIMKILVSKQSHFVKEGHLQKADALKLFSLPILDFTSKNPILFSLTNERE